MRPGDNQNPAVYGGSINSTEKGDIIQITDEAHPWFPCILVVGEAKSFGCQACVLQPESNDGTKKPSQAWNRLRTEQYKVVGKAEYLIE